MKSMMLMMSAIALFICTGASATRVITLTPDNHAVLFNQVTGESVGKAMMHLNQRLSNDTELFLYLNTPGGSVMAGNELIEQIRYLQELNYTISCIANNAYSMGFSILQACDNRYITSSSVLMQHQMSAKLPHQPLENLRSEWNFISQLNDAETVHQAARLNLTVEEFRNKVAHDWWLYGNNAVVAGAADEVVVTGCSPELYQSTHNETIRFFFFELELVYSDCPMVSYPLEISGATPDILSQYKEEYDKMFQRAVCTF